MRVDEIVQRAEVLADRVNGHPEHCEEVLPELLAMLDETDDPEALAALAYALGYACHEDAVAALLPYVNHPDGRVRLAVAQGLPHGVDESDELTSAVVQALLTLMSDEIDDVRDWSTFALGTGLHEVDAPQVRVDSPQVREALRARLLDPHLATRFEALVGLAYRRDPGVVERIRGELQADTVNRYVVDAARIVGDPSLVSDLEELKSWWDVDTNVLAAALWACRSGEPQDW